MTRLTSSAHNTHGPPPATAEDAHEVQQQRDRILAGVGHLRRVSARSGCMNHARHVE